MLTKPNILRLVFFLLAFAAALYYPVRKVLAFERPAVPPTEIRFRVKGYDPYDPMRGHYLRLDTVVSFELSREECGRQKKLFAGRKTAFAAVGPGKDGMTEVTALLPAAPAGKSFVKVRTFGFNTGCGKQKSYCWVQLPFDRYYLNEKLAGDAEDLLRNATRSSKHSAVLIVNLYADGRYAVRDLLIDGKPLREHLVPKRK